MVTEMRDYSRQESVLCQEKLKDAKVVIVGASQIANYACAYMSGLGIGSVMIFDDGAKGFLSQKCSLNEKLAEMNEEMDISVVMGGFDPYFIGKPDALADFTNSLASKEQTLYFALRENIPYISASSSYDKASMEVMHSVPRIERMLRMQRQKVEMQDIIMEGVLQGSFTSGLIAAIAVDEIRKAIAPVEGDEALPYSIGYSLHATDRFAKGVGHIGSTDCLRPISKRVLVAGAGGTGTHTVLSLAQLGVEIDVFDGDRIDATNLNRQVFYYSAVGRNKAETLAARLRALFPCEINATGENLTESHARRLRNYDAIFSCVDNPSSRLVLSDIAQEQGIPLFDSGVTAFSARMEAFVEGKSCLACSRGKDYGKQDGKAESCAAMHIPSVVMCNALAGAFQCGEFLRGFMDKGCMADKRMVYRSKPSGMKKFRVYNAEDYAKDKNYSCGRHKEKCGREKWQ